MPDNGMLLLDRFEMNAPHLHILVVSATLAPKPAYERINLAVSEDALHVAWPVEPARSGAQIAPDLDQHSKVVALAKAESAALSMALRHANR